MGKPRTVLPGSFIGGPRDMRSHYADALAIVRHTSKATYFVTMTCNPQWEEIVHALRHGERAEDRPDVTSRVFKMKLDQMIQDIKSGHVFGKVRAIVHVIEFQKRGLPHAHILVTIVAEEVPRDGDALDTFICAELPDPVLDAEAYKSWSAPTCCTAPAAPPSRCARA